MQTELVLILNTHIPDVVSDGVIFDEPENWLFEAITETYIPLIRALGRISAENLTTKKLILSLTPCLVEQLQTCTERYCLYLNVMQRIAHYELERTQDAEQFNRFAKHPRALSTDETNLLHKSAAAYAARIDDAIAFVAENNIATALHTLFADTLANGELWTSSPNHNYLPFFQPATIQHFVQRGVQQFQTAFGRAPDGFWLPECAFYPGVERVLMQAGVRQTAMVPTGISRYQPDLTSGYYRYDDLQILVHDYRLAMHLWKSGDTATLPSNPVYREFFRDVGWDVTGDYFDYLGIEIVPERRGRVWTGFKYHAITGNETDLGNKAFYNVDAVQGQLKADVDRFIEILHENRHLVFDRKTFIMAFDTELFGHWWHEGVDWLELLLRHNLDSGEAMTDA